MSLPHSAWGKIYVALKGVGNAVWSLGPYAMAAAIAAERIKAATGRSQEYANNVAVDCIVDLINAGYSIIPKKPG